MKPTKPIHLLALTLVLLVSFQPMREAQAQGATGRYIRLTLIPDYVTQTIRFDGRSALLSAEAPTELTGIPVHIDHNWTSSSDWNLVGSIDGTVEYDSETKLYHLRMGPFQLQPLDELILVLPFVNLHSDEVQPPAESVPNRVNALRYLGGAEGREITGIDIPFTPIARQIELRITPLLGEAFAGRTDAFRLSGRVQFSRLETYGDFAHYCQNSLSRLSHGDYRVYDLLYLLDFPHYFTGDVLNPIYQFKPTALALRSELVHCQFDMSEAMGQVDAFFSGRVFEFLSSSVFMPVQLVAEDTSDRNLLFVPSGFQGVRGYMVQLGSVLLGPEDQLTITMPDTDIQVDIVSPAPGGLSSQPRQQEAIIYHGPATLNISIPYIPRTGLFLRQFPAILRPRVELLERQLQGSLSPLYSSTGLKILLLLGLAGILVSLRFPLRGVLAVLGWLSVLIGLFFVLSGSYGIMAWTALLYMFDPLPLPVRFAGKRVVWGRLLRGALALGVVLVADYWNGESARIFQGLSEPDLTPFTPLILILVVVVLYILFSGGQRKIDGFSISMLPVLALLFAASALYDVFNASLMALVIFYAGCFYLFRRILSAYQNPAFKNDPFGRDLQKRFSLAFGNTLVPAALLVLVLFTMRSDLTSTYANELNITISGLPLPLVIPLLDLASILITFGSVAGLFVLIYPFLPFQAGYARAICLALFLFVVFLFGIGTDSRLLLSLPTILVGRVVYYCSVPLLIGLYFDIHAFMQKENKRRTKEAGEKKKVTFQAAGLMYLKNLQGVVGTVTGILSLVAPSAYAYIFSQPVISTYFSLLEKLVVPIGL